jgi:putative transposase
MSIRRVSFAFNEYFHIYNRGNSKQDIFKDNLDRDRFQTQLFLANGTTPFDLRRVEKDRVYDFDRGDQLVHIGAYCLMPNHFHILLTPAVEGGVHTFMQKLSTGYSMYFNKKYERTGVLFEGKFKARHADSDEYLKYLFSYIHLNPVKLIQSGWKEEGIRNIEGVKQYLNTYQYSSLMDYFGNRNQSRIIDAAKFPEYFKDKMEIDTELLSWLSYRELVEQDIELTKARPSYY